MTPSCTFLAYVHGNILPDIATCHVTALPRNSFFFYFCAAGQGREAAVMWVALVLVVTALAQVPEVCRNRSGWRFEWEQTNCTALIQMMLDSEVPCLTLEDPTLRMPLAADGVYAGETAKAIKAFQRRWHLKEDGVAGPATLSFLFPDPPLVQLVQLEAGRVAGVNPELEREAKADVTELLHHIRHSEEVGSTFRILGRPVFTPGVCGCQTFAAVSAITPDRWRVRGGLVDFDSACYNHDLCYARLPKSEEHRLGCDVAFWGDLKSACAKGLPLPSPLRDVCQAWTAVYFIAVRNFGAHAYQMAVL